MRPARRGDSADAGDARILLNAVMAREGVLIRNLAQDRELIAIGAGGEIGAKARPGIAAVGGLEEMVAAIVQSFGIVRGDDDGRVPLETVARRLVIVFEGADGAGFVGAEIAAQEIAILRFGVDDVGVVGIDL